MKLFSLEVKNAKETKLLAKYFAKSLFLMPPRDSAVVVALVGNLGSGKTTFAQGFLEACGVKKGGQSPTFVLMKKYSLLRNNFNIIRHIDAYRLERPRGLTRLGWNEWCQEKKSILLVEWADKIKKISPAHRFEIVFKHKGETKREMIFKIF